MDGCNGSHERNWALHNGNYNLESLDDELLFRVMGEPIGFENLRIEERFQIGYVDLTCL